MGNHVLVGSVRQNRCTEARFFNVCIEPHRVISASTPIRDLKFDANSFLCFRYRGSPTVPGIDPVPQQEELKTKK